MYLRTTQRKNKDGSVVTYYQLAHNLWDAEKKQSVTRVIHNFGRADSVTVASLCGCANRLPACVKSRSATFSPSQRLRPMKLCSRTARRHRGVGHLSAVGTVGNGANAARYRAKSRLLCVVRTGTSSDGHQLSQNRSLGCGIGGCNRPTFPHVTA